ncbi:MAG: PilZ domain-containing protein [Gammaproteobacteria bacterium]|jgi:hypothetical protein
MQETIRKGIIAIGKEGRDVYGALMFAGPTNKFAVAGSCWLFHRVSICRVDVDKNKQHFRIDRQHRRVAADIACEVGNDASDGLLPVRILNLSIGGLKFRCGMQVINSILPEDQRTPGQILDVEMDIVFDLPQAGDSSSPSVRTRATIVHSERLAQDEFHVGVQFIDLEQSMSVLLERYINILLEQESV